MSATNTATSTAPQAVTTLPQRKGIVKQVLSGDTIVIRAARGSPPPEKQITFFHVLAPKLARRPGAGGEETKDEPWAWESREYLRQKLIGEEVTFNFDKPTNSNREYGFVWLGKDESGENVVESIVREGLVTVRREGRQTPELQNLIDLEEQAKSAGRGKWSHLTPLDRQIKWTQENPAAIVERYAGEPVKAIIEHVRDGSTVRAFLLPEFHYITLMISGIRCPGVKLDAEGKPVLGFKIPYTDEARFYVELRLLQREVDIRLESVNNANFIGTILHPKGNIAESLLREGLAKCVDWSMVFMKTGADKLRAAERVAKEKRLRLWEDYQSKAPAINVKEKDFAGVVVEVFNGDAVNVKLSNGAIKKVFFSSIRPPRDTKTLVAGGDGGEEIMKITPRGKNFRPLYEIPFMFEAREFLRKKLIGKKVQCTLDYVSPARDNFPEKYCYTIVIGGQNVAEALVSKGLATCVRYRQDDDQRSSSYDQLLAAESQAIKGQKGMHGKKDSTLRINDLTVDHSRIKVQYLPSWQRALRTSGIIEFVASGSRLRLYIPRDSCLVTFLLAGISCPRASRPSLNGVPAQEGEPYGDEALVFTRDRIIQRDVTVHIETTDKAATAVIGWLWIDNKINLSIALVEEGLAEVHFSAEKSEYYRQLKTAEDSAKAAKKNIWTNYVEQEIVEKPVVVEEDTDDKVVEERVVNYVNVIITEVTGELTFFAQNVDNRSKLEALTNKLHAEFNNHPPIVGAYVPKKGDICAALFSIDKQWYRAKVERLQGNNANVLYIDYGNRETVPLNRLAGLPTGFSEPAYAVEYELALVKLPTDNEDKEEAVREFASDVLNREVQLNIEYKPQQGLPLATVYDLTTNVDLGKQLVADGLVLTGFRREGKLKELSKVYKNAQKAARSAHLAIWKYGDITQDDAPEFSH